MTREQHSTSSSWLDLSVSMVNDAKDTETTPSVVRIVLDGICGDRWAKPVARVSDAYAKALKNANDEGKPDPVAAAKESVKKMKMKLPGVLFSGTFKKRAESEVERHSGLLCCDLDNCREPAELRAKLALDPHVQAAFISPTSSGVKTLVRIRADASLHRASFLAAQKYFKETYGIEIDPACKDPSRLCFVTHDPHVFIREEDAEIFEPLFEQRERRQADTEGAQDHVTPDSEDDALLQAKVGAPVVLLPGGGIRINQAYFIHRFALEHIVLFETIEQAFYVYDHATGAWKYSDPGKIKSLLREDWLRLAPAFGGATLLAMGTDAFFNQIVNGLRSHVGATGAFQRLQRGFLHIGNHIIEIL
jgi:hypothetical protein